MTEPVGVGVGVETWKIKHETRGLLLGGDSRTGGTTRVGLAAEENDERPAGRGLRRRGKERLRMRWLARGERDAAEMGWTWG